MFIQLCKGIDVSFKRSESLLIAVNAEDLKILMKVIKVFGAFE
jgi:hypothetical protein